MSAEIVKNRIAGTRITVWDVLHYLENGRSVAEICRWLPITEEQVAAAIEYINDNREYVMDVHRQIEERNARGNPPKVVEKLKRSRAKMQAWLEKRRAESPSHAGAQ